MIDRFMKSKIYLLAPLLVSLVISSTGFSQITPPEDFLGFKPGADFHLANYEQAMGYFELIAEQTDRMQIFDMGSSSGRRRRSCTGWRR